LVCRRQAGNEQGRYGRVSDWRLCGVGMIWQANRSIAEWGDDDASVLQKMYSSSHQYELI
jgi:hypothetical protein